MKHLISSLLNGILTWLPTELLFFFFGLVFHEGWVALRDAAVGGLCVILQVVMLLACRAHKPTFFCSSGDQIVTRVAVSDWCCEKSTCSACDGLSLKEISVAIYLFFKGSFLVRTTSPKRRANTWSLWIFFCKTSNMRQLWQMLENVKCSAGHVACQV